MVLCLLSPWPLVVAKPDTYARLKARKLVEIKNAPESNSFTVSKCHFWGHSFRVI